MKRMYRCLCTMNRMAMTLVTLSLVASAEPARASESADTTRVLRGGEKGTVFESLTVEGEDRIRIDFDRPVLNVAVDPRQAPGLEWQDALDVVRRDQAPWISYAVGATATERPRHHSRPWLSRFVTGTIARFRPAVEGVDRWQLTVANSKGETVISFEGTGKPPKEIAWDGRSLDGTPAVPGHTYSYGLEAYDRAGNKRHFAGSGFKLPIYRIRTADGVAMLFSGEELIDNTVPATPVLLEAATWLNHATPPSEEIRVKATARTRDQADALAGKVIRRLQPLLLGDLERLSHVPVVEPDAPADGTISITVRGMIGSGQGE